MAPTSWWSAKDGQNLPSDTLSTIGSVLGGGGIAVPFAYAVARTADGHSVVVAGTDLEQVQKLDSTWWSVTAWPKASYDALVGARAVSVVGPRTNRSTLAFKVAPIRLNPVGTLQTGAAEDSRVYISLADFTEWTHVPYSTVEISASGPPEEISTSIQRLGQALPAADVHPVRQVTEGEANVLGKMRATLLVAAILIILTAAVCVLSTLTGWVSDRRRDFALMKASGRFRQNAAKLLCRRSRCPGCDRRTLGFAIGVGVAIWIGQGELSCPGDSASERVAGHSWRRNSSSPCSRRLCQYPCCGEFNLLTS